MTAFSLFSGIGAHDAGLQAAGIRIVGQCEIDPFACAVLEKHWKGLPRWNDVRGLTATAIRERCGDIDLIAAGFPCQDISVAGKGAGLAGERSGLFLEIVRLLGEFAGLGRRVPWVFLENVPALRGRGCERVIAELEGVGYSVIDPQVVGAWAVGAPHKRDRVWIVAHDSSGWQRGRLADSGSDGIREQRGRAGRSREAAASVTGTSGGHLAHPQRIRRERRQGREAGSIADGQDAGRLESHDQLAGEHPDDFCPFPGGCWRCGNELANASGAGLAGRRELAGRAQQKISVSACGGDRQWPARPGEPQHEWEPPRLVSWESQQSLGRNLDGPTTRLVRAANRNALRCLGAANPPCVPEIVGRWLMRLNY